MKSKQERKKGTKRTKQTNKKNRNKWVPQLPLMAWPMHFGGFASPCVASGERRTLLPNSSSTGCRSRRDRVAVRRVERLGVGPAPQRLRWRGYPLADLHGTLKPRVLQSISSVHVSLQVGNGHGTAGQQELDFWSGIEDGSRRICWDVTLLQKAVGASLSLPTRGKGLLGRPKPLFQGIVDGFV